MRVRPVVAITTCLAFGAYSFWVARQWARSNPGNRATASVLVYPYTVGLGAGALAVFSGLCSGPWLGRSSHRRHTLRPQCVGPPGAEVAQRVSEEIRSQILQGISIPLFVIDRNHTVTHWNQACENLTGVSAQQIVGTRQAWHAFYAHGRPVMAELVMDPRPRDAILAIHGNKCRESSILPGAYELEAFFPRLGDTGKWLFCTAVPLRDADGTVIGAIETFQDMTERKRAEEELQKLASVVRHSSELINLVTPDGKMVFLNEAGRKMLGIEADEVQQTHIMQVVPDHLREQMRTEILPALLECRAWEGDLQYRHLKTGRPTDVHALTFAITDPGTGAPLYLANVSLDITERKRMEQELQQRIAELSDAKRRLEVLVSNMTDRERRMVDLKREVNELLQVLGREAKYQVPRTVAELSGSTPDP